MKYGWKKDSIDHRDIKFKLTASISLPPVIDLRNDCTPVDNQGNLGACTAHSLAGAIEFLEKKDNQTIIDVSRLFIYFNERLSEGTVDSDSGAALRDGIKSLASFGVCQESLWPYDSNNLTIKPTNECYIEAQDHQITSYQSLNDLNDIKQCLATGFPVAFGFQVFASFESQTVATTGIVPMPQPNEECLGGHAVLAVGYDDTKQAILVRNSWGLDWGMSGYFTLPYDYMTSQFSSDYWTIRKTKSE